MSTAVQFALVPSFSTLSFSDSAPIGAALFHVLKARNRDESPKVLADSLTAATGATTVGDLRRMTDPEWRALELPAVARVYLKYVVRQSQRKEDGDKSFLDLLQDDFNYGQPFDMTLYQENVKMLAAMGFSSDEAMEALVITENKGIEPALELLFHSDREQRDRVRAEAVAKQGRRLDAPPPPGPNDPKMAVVQRRLHGERQQREKVEVELSSVKAAHRLQVYSSFLAGLTASEQINVAAAERHREERKSRGINDTEHKQALKMINLSEPEFDSMKNFNKGGGKLDSECVVCLDKPRDHVVMNCMHLCLCEDCAKDFTDAKAKCPLCSRKARKVTKIFT